MKRQRVLETRAPELKRGQMRGRRRITRLVASGSAVLVLALVLVSQATLEGPRSVLFIGLALASLGAVVWSTPAPFGANAPGKPPPGWLFVDHLAREFERSRRHARTFVVARLDFRSEDDARVAAGGIGPMLRQTDVLGQSRERVFLLLPETAHEDAQLLLKRLVDQVDAAATSGLVEYPTDGVTVGGLLDVLDARRARRELAGDRSFDPFRQLSFPGWFGRNPAMLSAEIGKLRVKRLADLVALALVAPFVLPCGLLLALAIRLDSPGPVMFTQQRTGLHGQRFKMYKFRSMVVNAEELKASLQHLNLLEPPDFKVIDDPRITRVGRILRATSLDELPQLLNVLRSDMTFVGPRPTSFTADLYAAWHTQRLEVPPGITGLWQVNARHESGLDERLRLDVEYMTHMSLWTDLRIVGRTVTSVLRAKGA